MLRQPATTAPTSLAVAEPAIEEVLDLVTGEYLPAATVIGTDRDKVS